MRKLGFLALLAAGTASAQWPTIDVAAVTQMGKIWQENATISARALQEVQQAQKIFTVGMNTYVLATSMAQSMKYSQRLAFMTMIQAATNDYTKNTYGTTIQWPLMINGHPQLAPQAWATATAQVPQFPTLPADPRLASGMQASIASLQIADGSSSKCLQTVAGYRQNIPQSQAALSALRAAITSQFPQLNTYAAQMNMGNAGQSQSQAEAMAHGQLEGCLVEQQIIAAKVQRDKLAADLNYQQHLQTVVANNPNDWDGQPAQMNLP